MSSSATTTPAPRKAHQRARRSLKGAGSSASDNGERQRRTLTCTNCRIRKTRCDGNQPGCKTCEVYKDECRYEKPPPMSQIVAMAKRLQEAKETIANLRAAGAHSARAPQESRESRESSFVPHVESCGPSGNLGDVLSVKDETTLSVSTQDEFSPEEPLISDLSLDENGKICYYGPTSAVHEPPNLENRPSPISDESHPSKIEIRSMLTSNAMELRAWEEFALGNVAFQNDMPRATISNLLQIHWSWISPMFMWVYRPAFMRDMTTDGPYFSQFLLVVLCAHAARFQDGTIGDMLIARARLLLGTEIHRPSSIPTAQALLQLSARELAYGSISEAWLYSGMAFRMVNDLGLHHNCRRISGLGQLSAEDLEIGTRLFWSCYFWDKAISLYLGRMPALTELPSNSNDSPELLDDFTEFELWTPHYGDSGNLSQMPKDAYPAMKSYAISCFGNSCKLAVILNDIVLRLYSKTPASESERSLACIRKKLDAWRQQSPSHLVLDPDALPNISPPAHILTQNLLYYATIILLHRPFYSSDIHHIACRNASSSIEKLLVLLERTFGFTRVTYHIAYCVYTAASATIPDVKAGDLEATSRMATFRRALQEAITSCPIVQRSIDIINNSLPLDPSALGPTKQHIIDGNRNYLPAFPYQSEYSDETMFGNTDFDASLLECFPENHIDNTMASGWYWPTR